MNIIERLIRRAKEVDAKQRNDIFHPVLPPLHTLYKLAFNVTYLVEVKTDTNKNWTLAGEAGLTDEQLARLDAYICRVLDNLNLLTVQKSEVDTLGQVFTRQLNSQLEEIFGIHEMFGAGKTTVYDEVLRESIKVDDLDPEEDVKFQSASVSVQTGEMIDVCYLLHVHTSWHAAKGGNIEDTECCYDYIDNQEIIQNLASALKDIFETRGENEDMAMSLKRAFGSMYRQSLDAQKGIPGITAITIVPGEVHHVTPFDYKENVLARRRWRLRRV